MGKAICENRRARYDYEIIESLEAGIVLNGQEIKAIRAGKVNISGSYGKIFFKDQKPEVWLVGASIVSIEGDQSRSRKLLLHKDQIAKLIGKVQEKGLSLIPLRLYFNRGYAKLEIGVGRGLKKYDKREKVKERDVERRTRRGQYR